MQSSIFFPYERERALNVIERAIAWARFANDYDLSCSGRGLVVHVPGRTIRAVSYDAVDRRMTTSTILPDGSVPERWKAAVLFAHDVLCERKGFTELLFGWRSSREQRYAMILFRWRKVVVAALDDEDFALSSADPTEPCRFHRLMTEFRRRDPTDENEVEEIFRDVREGRRPSSPAP